MMFLLEKDWMDLKLNSVLEVGINLQKIRDYLEWNLPTLKRFTLLLYLMWHINEERGKVLPIDDSEEDRYSTVLRTEPVAEPQSQSKPQAKEQNPSLSTSSLPKSGQVSSPVQGKPAENSVPPAASSSTPTATTTSTTSASTGETSNASLKSKLNPNAKAFTSKFTVDDFAPPSHQVPGVGPPPAFANSPYIEQGTEDFSVFYEGLTSEDLILEEEDPYAWYGPELEGPGFEYAPVHPYGPPAPVMWAPGGYPGYSPPPSYGMIYVHPGRQVPGSPPQGGHPHSPHSPHSPQSGQSRGGRGRGRGGRGGAFRVPNTDVLPQ
eukprot:TRINITY_DN2823_c0_g1_i1.p1 TRINITY_DN2823_c0_g1~~TRINITY_DN2823_c0_g1_i1.p1  ORF type:complete len:321 (-),score=69.47 TRINITY_DN2823_c0_g1_i1:48-1010(-)